MVNFGIGSDIRLCLIVVIVISNQIWRQQLILSNKIHHGHFLPNQLTDKKEIEERQCHFLDKLKLFVKL